MIGRIISHYRIVEKLGEGGMGVVYRAEDLDLKVPRALKFLPPHAAARAEDRTRLEREAQAAAGLEHPNICPVHEIGFADDQAYIVMSYLEGRTLAQRLASEGPLPVTDALEITTQVGRALSRAHAAGVVHRDIKPANIMLTSEPADSKPSVGSRAVVMDFGLALASDMTRVTRTGTALGTAAYMSPEQVRGQPVDGRTDVWALGVVLWEMLAGKPLFKGENLAAVVHAVQQEEPAPLVQVRPEVPADLVKVVERALAKKAEQRYQSVDELLSDLQAVQDEQELSRKTAHYDRRRRLKRRRRLVVGFLTAAVLAAAALIFWPRAERIDALAVLPFANLSGDLRQEYFADGMTEALITELQQLAADQLRVISRTSIMRYKNTDKPLSDIAQELGVDAIVEASVTRSGDQIKVAVKLIRARPEEQQMWAESFDRSLTDVLALQAQIAGTIADELALRLDPGAEARLEKVREREVDPQALEHYLRAREKSGLMMTDEIYAEALRNYQEALSLDPSFAEAYAGLASYYTWAAYLTMIPPHESLPYAKLMAQKALDLDPRSAEAVLAKANVAFYFDWEWDKPDLDYRRAIALNPSDPDLHSSYGHYLVHVGRFDEAIDQIQIAADMTPDAGSQLYSIGWANLYAGRPAKTLEMAFEHREKHPDDLLAFFSMAWAYSMLGQHDEAVAAADSLEQLSALPAKTGFPSVIYWMRGKTYAEAGKRDKARAMIRALEDLAKERYIDPWYVAQIHERLGDLDQTFAWLERAYEVHSVALVDLRLDLGHLADDPRYQDLARRVGIPLG